MGDVTRNSYSTGWSGYNYTVFTYSLVCPTNTTGMVVWIVGNKNTANTIVSLKWNGTNLTKRREYLTTNYHSMWTLENPDIGSYNLVLTWTGQINWFEVSVPWFKNSKPGDMLGQTAISATGGTVNVTAGSVTDIVLACGTHYNNTNPVVSGGDLTQWFVYGNDMCVGYKESPSTSTPTACNFANDSTASAAVIKGVAGGPTAIAMFYKRYQDFMDRLRQGLIPQNRLEKEYGWVMSSMPQPVKLIKTDIMRSICR